MGTKLLLKVIKAIIIIIRLGLRNPRKKEKERIESCGVTPPLYPPPA